MRLIAPLKEAWRTDPGLPNLDYPNPKVMKENSHPVRISKGWQKRRVSTTGASVWECVEGQKMFQSVDWIVESGHGCVGFLSGWPGGTVWCVRRLAW